MTSVPPPGPAAASSPQEKPLIDQVIDGALLRLKGKVKEIKAEEVLHDGKPDDDHNHKISLTLKTDETEPASLFALKLNGNPKKLPELIAEMTRKIENHLTNREKDGIIKFESGALLVSTLSTPIGTKNGYVAIDGKIVVMKRGDKYMPVPSLFLQTYTLYQASQEENLIILTDDHEGVRDDGKEGMIVHLKQGKGLNKDELEPHPKDPHKDKLADKDTYLILYRKRSEVPQ